MLLRIGRPGWGEIADRAPTRSKEMTAQRPQHLASAVLPERRPVALGQRGVGDESSPGLHLELAQGHHVDASQSVSYPAADVRVGSGDDLQLRHSGSVREADLDFCLFHAPSVSPGRDAASPATEHLCDIARPLPGAAGSGIRAYFCGSESRTCRTRSSSALVENGFSRHSSPGSRTPRWEMTSSAYPEQ